MVPLVNGFHIKGETLEGGVVGEFESSSSHGTIWKTSIKGKCIWVRSSRGKIGQILSSKKARICSSVIVAFKVI